MATVAPPNERLWNEGGGSSVAGVRVTPTTALTYSGCWAATNAIAGMFGALPCKVYKKTSAGREEAGTHELYRVLGREPNPDMDSFTFWEMMTHWWINYGNAYAEKVTTSSSGRIAELWPIHPSRVRDEKETSGKLTGRYLIRSETGQDVIFESEELFNLVGHLSEDGRKGKGLFAYAAMAIGVGLAQQKYESEFYGKGGRPSGVLLHKGKLGPEARDSLRREWRTIHHEGNEIAVLWEDMQYQTISVDPEHAQLIESKLGTIQDLCRFYDLPPHVLYELSKGTFANTEEMNRFLVSQPLNRRLVRVERALDRQLFTDQEKKQGYYTKFNVKALLRGTPKEQAEVAQIEFQNGFLSADEYRELTERNKLPEGMGEMYWVRRDMATIEHVVASQEAAAEQAAADIETARNPQPPVAPEKPDTPPVPDPADELRERITALSEQITSVTAERDQWHTQFAELQDIAGEHEERIEALTQDNFRLAECEASATRKLSTVETQLEHARTVAAEHETACKTAETLLSEAKEAFIASEAEVSRLSGQLTALDRKHEAHVAKSAERVDELKARIDKLSSELGTARAERSTLASQVQLLTKARDEALLSVAEATGKAESAQQSVKAAESLATEAESRSIERLNVAKRAVTASVRGLLDESLEFLLFKERQEIREASRKPDTFKLKAAAYYAHFSDQLTSQLSKASDALENLGAERIDVAKIAAQYVAESRTRLNNVSNTTPRDDLRIAVRKETDSWESRKQQLLDWIG
jgi:HK97 family phage portal protein